MQNKLNIKMDSIFQILVFLKALISCIHSREISPVCLPIIYKEYVCVTYNCTENLEDTNFFQKNLSNFNNPRSSKVCEIQDSEEMEDEKQFKKRYIQIGNKTTYYQNMDKKKAKDEYYCYAQLGESGSKICSPKLYKPNEVIRIFQKTSAFVSPIFIFLPILIFILTRDIQNVHGLTHFSNGCCVFALYISWGLKYVHFRDSGTAGVIPCTTFALIQHYLHLSVFSWLVVACHDLQKLAACTPSGKNMDIKKQLLMYLQLSLFGWGFPAGYIALWKLIGILFTSTLDPNQNPLLASYILPEYGKYRCFLAFNAYWFHLFVPTFTLFTAANYFNWATLRIIVRTKNALSGQHAVQKMNVMRNMACLRAMFIASVCWGADVARTFITAYDRSSFLWLRVIFDTIIVYQTIPIFLIYSCRPHILNHLEEKYPKLKWGIEASRKSFHIKRKEVEPDVVTELRVHRKSTADFLEVDEPSATSSEL